MVPIRSFAEGKSRLAPTLDAVDRARLARSTAEVVVTPRPDVDLFVVCDDPDVESWARTRGATAVRVDRRGLNESLTAAAPIVGAATTAEVVAVVHADLPLAERVADDVLAVVGDRRAPFVAIVTDRHDDGTNVLVLDRATFVGWPFGYGAGSCERHAAVARRLGHEPIVVRHPRLSIDLDDPVDLDRPEVQDFLDRVLPARPAGLDRSAS